MADSESIEAKSDVNTANRHAREASEALKKLEKAHAISLKDREALRALLDTFASEEPSDKGPAGAKAYGPATSLQPMAPSTLSPAGGSQPHDNMAPYLTVNYIIALQGIFPSRG